MNWVRSFTKRSLHKLLFFTFWLLILLNLPLLCYGDNRNEHQQHHHHHHHHHHLHEHEEPPSFKYSRHANEPYHENIQDQKTEYLWMQWIKAFTSSFLSTFKQSDENASVWSQALGSTLLISAAPFFILFFVPLDRSKEKEPLLKILLSFASGGLLGDSFLHLIPHALSPHSGDGGHHSDVAHSDAVHHDHDHHSHSHCQIGFFVLLGIVVFLIVEKSVRLVNTGHSHSFHLESKQSKKDCQEKSDNSKKESSGKDSKKGNSKQPKQKGAITVSGYLNLAADFIHNLTDGLAIGASYLAGNNIGFITTVTILLHEVPHEIGDFAILIQSGCSRKKAMGLQLITALGALLGTLIALMTEGAGGVASSWILPFTAGGFIYISTVSIIPELLEDSSFFQSFKEIVAMLIGVLLMIVIADVE